MTKPLKSSLQYTLLVTHGTTPQIAQQKSQIQTLEQQLSTVSATDSALVEAQAQTVALKSELEKLQG